MLKFQNKIPSALTIGGKIVERIKMRNEVVWEKEVEPVDVDYFYVENTYNGTNTVSVKQTIEGSPDSSLYSKTLQYSKDKTNWTTITLSSTAYTINLNQGEKVYFRGNEGVFNHYIIRGTEKVYTKITGNQSHNVGGNINTLINYYTPNILTLPQGVFNNLFSGNINLVSAENLTLQPSLDGSLPVFAYLYLFRNCTNLIKPPVLIAKTLSNSSYYSMFEGCTSLNNLTVYADDVSATNCTYNWLNNVAPEGIFNNLGTATYTINSPSGIPTGWVENKNEYFYIENTYAGTNTVSVKQTISGSPDSSTYAKSVQFSKNRSDWETITLSSTAYTIDLNQGEKVYFRNNEGVFNYYGNSGETIATTTITGTESHTVGGNINTLLDYNNPNGLTLKQGAFARLFIDNTKLTSASDLTLQPSVDGSISTYGYTYLFKGCSGLITPPSVIPATKQGHGSCSHMFNGCSSLLTAPVLSATTLANYCYRSLFYGCTSLVQAPELPATTLAYYCYQEMYMGCSSLVQAPELPATTLADYCYRSLFYGCTSLVQASELPATNLAPYCYQEMYMGCSSLVNAPELPATTLANYCYQGIFRDCTSLVQPPSVIPAETAPYMSCHRMFNGCSSLKSTPQLNATTVGSGAYQYMFQGCSSLVQTQLELPAETLTLNCYYAMYENCTSLKSAPIIKAKTFAENSCTAMFRACTQLNNITVYADDISATNSTFEWLYRVASSGIFNNMGTATYTINSPSGIPTGWIEKKDDIDYLYIENLNSGTNTVSINTIVDDPPSTAITNTYYSTSLQYSKNCKDWTTITLSENNEHLISLNKGERVYFRNDSGYFNWCGDFGNDMFSTYFQCSDNFSVGGSIMSLIDYNNINTALLSDGCFNNLFNYADTLTDASYLKMPDKTSKYCFLKTFMNCSSLKNAPQIFPAMTLNSQCYYSTFDNCTSLVNAPELPATTLVRDCYYHLFSGCTSLVNAPELPATTLASSCYEGTFSGCTSLVNAPELPATTLANYCYKSLFSGCTSLVNAPELPATTMAYNCYGGLFSGCTSLVNAPELPATTLAQLCYQYTFSGCTSLVNAPELPAEKLEPYCYQSLFSGCTKLNNVTIYANDNSATNCLRNWLYNVFPSGTFRNLGSATYSRNSDGIPTGWTEVKS